MKMVDKNSMRAGAGLSAMVLLLAYALQWRWMIPVIAAVLAMGALFGLRYSPLGFIYRFAKRAFKLNIGIDPEEQAPPRFAQAVGTAFLSGATLAFYAGSHNTLGWILALIVAALQGLLAATGICVGCEMYLLGKRMVA